MAATSAPASLVGETWFSKGRALKGKSRYWPTPTLRSTPGELTSASTSTTALAFTESSTGVMLVVVSARM